MNNCNTFHKIILNYSLYNLASKQADVQQSTQNKNEESRETVAGQGTYSKVKQPSNIFDSKAYIPASVKSETVSGGQQNTTKNKSETHIAGTHPSPTRNCHHEQSMHAEAKRNDIIKPTQANDVKTKHDDSQLEHVNDSQPKKKDNDSDVSVIFAMCLKLVGCTRVKKISYR